VDDHNLLAAANRRAAAAICGTLDDFLREPHAELAHVHLHNRGPADTGDPHLPLGRGVVNARAVLRAPAAPP